MAISRNTPKQAELKIDFVIIGGGIAGLACAAALRRVGHRALVLERDMRLDKSTGGTRMPPNLSKILYHWGLKEKLQEIAIKSQAIDLCLFESGELLGKHIWDEEVLRETRGEFIFTHHADLRKLMYETAVSYGAKVRLGVVVKSIDPDARTVALESGEIIKADVIVGADGPNGISRQYVEPDYEEVPTGINMYCSTVSRKVMMEDPELRYFWDQELTSMAAWFGNGHAVLGFPTGGRPEFALFVYGPADGCEGTWDDPAPLSQLQSMLSQCEPRLRKMGRLASPPQCIPVNQFSEVETWVHEGGRMVIIGQAAHPIPPGSIQESAMTVEDGAVLAKLFSHLRSEDQIGSFLWAFEDIRQPRCTEVMQKEVGIVQYMTMPPGEMQQYRDESMRAKRDAGLNALEASDELEETPEWKEIKEIFGYDAEDEADNWWVEWGLLRMRANGLQVPEVLDVQMTLSTDS